MKNAMCFLGIFAGVLAIGYLSFQAQKYVIRDIARDVVKEELEWRGIRPMAGPVAVPAMSVGYSPHVESNDEANAKMKAMSMQSTVRTKVLKAEQKAFDMLNMMPLDQISKVPSFGEVDPTINPVVKTPSGYRVWSPDLKAPVSVDMVHRR